MAENRDEGEGREEQKEEKERGMVKEGTQSREKGARLANEYILDGFDFSTGACSCGQLLDDPYRISFVISVLTTITTSISSCTVYLDTGGF